MRNNKCILCQSNLIHYSIKESYENDSLYDTTEMQDCVSCSHETEIRVLFKNKKIHYHLH